MKRSQRQAFFAKKLSDIRTIIEQKQRELGALCMEAHISKAKNVHAVRAQRRELAQLLTMYRIKELSDAK